MNNRIIINIISAVALILGVGLVLFFPIYPDEIAYKIFLERHWVSGGYKESMALFCNEGFLYKVPLPLVPASIFWSFIKLLGISWWSFRLIPLTFICALFLILAQYNLRNNKKDFFPIFLLVTFGTCVYGILLLRAEIIILLGAVLLFFLSNSLINSKKPLNSIYYIFLLLIFIDIVCFVHPKATYLVVIPLVAACLLFRQSNPIRGKIFIFIAFVSCTITIVVSATLMHQAQFTSCNLMPELQGRMNQQAVNPLDVFQNPAQFLSGLSEALSIDKFKIAFDRVTYVNTFQSNYLPPIKNLSLFEIFINYSIKVMVIILCLYLFMKVIYILKKNVFDDKFYLIFCVIISLLTPFFLNLTKHFYEVSFFFVSLLIVTLLLWPYQFINLDKFKRNFIGLIYISLIFISFSSSGLNFYNFSLDFIGGYEGPGQAFWGSREKIRHEVGQYFITNSIDPNAAIIIDDFTYDLVSDHPIVIPVTYLTWLGNGHPDILDSFINKYEIKYGVVQCDMVPIVKTLMSISSSYEINESPFKDGTASLKKPTCIFRLNP